MQNKHIRSLDTLRGLAALAVCISHGTPIFGLDKIIHHAYLSVDFFFALSGFILVNRYQAMIEGNNEKPAINFSQFAIIRLARLYPLYFFAYVIGAAFILLKLLANNNFSLGISQFIGSSLFGALALPYFATDNLNSESPVFPFATQAWSIFWEFCVSGAFFFWVTNGKKHIKPIALLCFIALACFTIPDKTIDGGWQTYNFPIGGLRAFFSFSMGIICAQYLAHKKPKKLPMTYFGYFAFIIAAYYMAFERNTFVFVELFLVSIIFPIVIIGISQSNSPIFNNAIGDWLGGISYSVYLLHGISTAVLIVLIGKFTIFTPSILLGTIWLAAVLIGSTLVWKIFEIPAQKWFRNRFYKLV